MVENIWIERLWKDAREQVRRACADLEKNSALPEVGGLPCNIEYRVGNIKIGIGEWSFTILVRRQDC